MVLEKYLDAMILTVGKKPMVDEKQLVAPSQKVMVSTKRKASLIRWDRAIHLG
jgi:hypothetical protein